jgi:hypothetical protein
VPPLPLITRDKAILGWFPAPTVTRRVTTAAWPPDHCCVVTVIIIIPLTTVPTSQNLGFNFSRDWGEASYGRFMYCNPSNP